MAIAGITGESTATTADPPKAQGLWLVDPVAAPADPALIGTIGASACIRMGLLPWRRMGGAVVILAPDTETFVLHGAALAALGPLRLALCRPEAIRAGLRLAGDELLVQEAETRTAPEDSCRDLGRGRPLLIGAGLFLVLAVAVPELALAVLLGLGILGLVLTTLWRLAALIAGGTPSATVPPGDLAPAMLPVISILVPLFREREIAGHLLAHLARLDYPADRLDICLILEEEDALTCEALAQADLPPHVQVIEVPRGTIRTKPRAMNFALNFARGTIIGIYDAEDRPAPDQLLRVARHFARAAPEVACLQGALDYYNSRTNWIARCFTLEYAAWFRVILPGTARLGLVVPLGGTTLFLRRHAIESVGGWDAHNVTEDADLGVRLMRRGYRTELIDTVTGEEANARPWPWIRQRTRWLKGYALTWAVHNRDPLRLWRDLGPWRFLGLQVLFLGTLSQFLLAPLFLSFWLVGLGIHPGLSTLLPNGAGIVLIGLFLLAELVNFAAAFLGLRRAGKGRLILSYPFFHLYYPMATVAAWRAVWQAVRDPFRWEKTAHGIFVTPEGADRPAETPRPPAPVGHPVSAG